MGLLRDNKPESEGDHSPGSVLVSRAQYHRTCRQWTGQDAGNGLHQQPQEKESTQSGLGPASDWQSHRQEWK